MERRYTCGVEYFLSRSKRKSVGIIIKEGRVFIKSPLRISSEAIEGFIASRIEWVRQKICLQQEREKHLSEFYLFKRFYLHGREYGGEYTDGKSVCFEDENFLLPQKLMGDQVELRKAVIKFYTRYANDYLAQRLKEFSEKTNLPFHKFNLTNAKGKWGSCSSRLEIRLNWRLIFLSDYAVDYVILHELCHTYYQNHSKTFWNFVQNLCPDYKKRKAELKKNSAIIGLYR